MGDDGDVNTEDDDEKNVFDPFEMKDEYDVRTLKEVAKIVQENIDILARTIQAELLSKNSAVISEMLGIARQREDPWRRKMKNGKN